MMLLAASNWPLGVLIALPVLGILFFSAIKFARNSRQRMANMLLGTLGTIAGLVALVIYAEQPEIRLGDYIAVAAPAAMMVGAALGVAVSVGIRCDIARMIKGSTNQMEARDLAVRIVLLVTISGLLTAGRCYCDSRHPGAGDFVSVVIVNAAIPLDHFNVWVAFWVLRSAMTSGVAVVAFWLIPTRTTNYATVLMLCFLINILMGLGHLVFA
jgi:hypothetical protein